MIVATDKSTLMAQFKCGTKGLQDIDKKCNQTEELLVNYAYGQDFIKALRIKSLRLDHLNLSPNTIKNLTILLEEENTKPFFLFIRNVDNLFKSQIAQSLRNFCRKYTIFEENITLSGRDIQEKEQMFKIIKSLYPSFTTEIFTDPHYITYTFDQALEFIQYIEINRKDIFDNLFILDLDEYDTSRESLQLLYDYKVVDETYLKKVNWTHSTKTLYLPEVLSSEKITGIFKVPYEKNKAALGLIRLLYYNKLYSYERLKTIK